MTDGEKGLDLHCFHAAVAYYSCNRLNIQLHALQREIQVRSKGIDELLHLGRDTS